MFDPDTDLSGDKMSGTSCAIRRLLSFSGKHNDEDDMSEDIHRNIGRLEEAVDTLKGDMHAMRSDVAAIREMLATHKGGRKMLLTLMSISAALSAAVTTLLSWLRPHP